MSPKKDPKFKDYIDYKHEIVKNINSEQSKLIEKYYPIIKALREKYMTVKEIHDLYYDEEKKKHEYTIKTIYRYLDELEDMDLVVVAGHRVTEGSRVYEKLYTRTATIFYKQMDEEYRKYKKEYYQNLIKDLYNVLKILYDKPELLLEDLEKALLPFYTISHSKVDNLMGEIEKNPELAEFYKSISIDRINNLNQNIGMLMTFLSNPEILENLKKTLL